MKKDLSNSKYFVCTRFYLICIFFTLLIAVSGCKKFLEVDLNKTKIDRANVFTDDVAATSAVMGMYVNLLSTNGFASGERNSVWALAGSSSDELIVEPNSAELKQFENSSITVDNTYIQNAWDNMYWTIYQANSIIEGLEASDDVTPATKKQLQGEAYFIRAFTHFYLVNLFGEVPLITTTDYKANANIARSTQEVVYNQIENDLTKARELLVESYPTSERIRPNKAAATALLSRVLLYLERWDDAVKQADEVIGDSNYELLPDLNDVFLTVSKEAIWQLKIHVDGFNTYEGRRQILTRTPSSLRPFSMNGSLYTSFESGDKRFKSWIKTLNSSGVSYNYSFKYKRTDGSPITEYSMVMRLAEQYLIRAEAKAHNGDLAGAIDDLDAIRNRAGLPLISYTNPGISKANLLLAIEQERKVELFVEWGHRWLDLKRTGRANAVLAPLKGNWEPTDILYPLPKSEINSNPALGGQNNPGY